MLKKSREHDEEDDVQKNELTHKRRGLDTILKLTKHDKSTRLLPIVFEN